MRSSGRHIACQIYCLLREIAKVRPSDRAAMLALNGMGEKMWDLVGSQFLEIVQAFED